MTFGVERTVFEVDMNSVRNDGTVSTLLRHATSFPLVPHLEEGDTVYVRDELGTLWQAEVASLRGDLVRLVLRLWAAQSHVVVPPDTAFVGWRPGAQTTTGYTKVAV